MEKYIQLFEKLGIPEKTARIYLTLLEHGTLSISDICNKWNLHRPEVYRALPLLEEEKLIQGTIKWKRTLYRALSPERIEELIRDFERKNAPIVSELRQKYENLSSDISVSYQEGKNAIARVFDDIIETLPKNGVFYRVSAEDDVEQANTHLPKDYRERRDKKSLERYVIMGSKAAQAKAPRLERELVVIPRSVDEFDENVSMTIYNNKIAYIDFTHKSSIIIENPMIAEFQKKLFMLTYRNLKK